MTPRFNEQLVVVTGGAQGIGKAIACLIAEEGGHVVICDRATEAAHAAVDDLTGRGLRATAVIGDLSTASGAEEAMRAAAAVVGRIDVLINNVGGTIWIKPLVAYTATEVEAELQRSLFPTLWCTLAVLPQMLRQGSGSIVNIGSSAVRGILRVPYATAKGGVIGLTTSLARELARDGIRVNCVAPGATVVNDRVTVRNAEAPTEDTERWRAELSEFQMNYIPMGRRGTVEEQAAAIAFMASSDAAFITGQVLTVAGGVTVP